MPVCIAGMHRSGTSLLSNLLQMCGLYQGQQRDMLPAKSDNENGYWENEKFVLLNEEILKVLGGRWNCPPRMDNGWSDEEGLSAVKSKAELLLQEFCDHEPWGWKDPRNCLTQPFWRRLLPDLKTVICVRNPLEVAESLRRSQHTPNRAGLSLWWIYNQSIIDNTPRKKRIVCHYDSYFKDPHGELNRLLSFLGMSIPQAVIEQCDSVVSNRLRHNRFTTVDLLEAGVLPEIFDLYMQLCDEAGFTDEPPYIVNK
jgi:hypothetical protein